MKHYVAVFLHNLLMQMLPLPNHTMDPCSDSYDELDIEFHVFCIRKIIQ